MTHGRSKRRGGRIRPVIVSTAIILGLTATGSCRRTGDQRAIAPSAVLRVGVAQLSATDPMAGLRQLSQILTVEGLARTGEDGRMQPWLAEGWTAGADGRSLTVKLRPNVKFHDGSPADAKAVADVLPEALRGLMGPLYSDVEYVRASGSNAVEIRSRGTAPFLIESLEATIQKGGTAGVGTGPFVNVRNSTTELRANADYYLGRPIIDAIHVESYPSVRTAWAEMLRGRLDMLLEVGADALDSMERSTTVSVFTFARRYQYVIALNLKAPAMRSPAVRKALSTAIDRRAVVRNGLIEHGVVSSGPIWPRYWALPKGSPRFEFDPKGAAAVVEKRLPFTCLVSPDAVNERIALEVKRQLQVMGVTMSVEEVARDQILHRMAEGKYEAALIELISGPTLFRPYLVWHSKTPLNWAHFGNATIDAALDRVRQAPSEEAYRQAVGGLQQAFMDDPPAIFLAWSVQTRAVSKRFEVQAEEGRDVLSTLRLWKPTSTGQQQASRN